MPPMILMIDDSFKSEILDEITDDLTITHRVKKMLEVV